MKCRRERVRRNDNNELPELAAADLWIGASASHDPDLLDAVAEVEEEITGESGLVRNDRDEALIRAHLSTGHSEEAQRGATRHEYGVRGHECRRTALQSG